MPSSSTVKPYHWLAQYYDQIFRPLREPMDAAREHLLRDIMPGVESACDLACGTGSTALAFARQCIRSYAVDLSPWMCREVRRNAREAGVPVRVIRADMRDFRLPQPVDLITCEFDGINHVPRKSDLSKVARAAARALRPGGHFFFDVNNALGFASYWHGNVCFEHPGVLLLLRNGNDARTRRAWSNVDWFIRDGAVWRRHSERVEEICWEPAEIRNALEKAGFDEVREWDAAPFFDPQSLIGPGCRSFYIARRGVRRRAAAGPR